MKRIKRDTYQLSSGREIEANRGIIGLSVNDGKWEVSEGYDGHIHEAVGSFVQPEPTEWTDPPLTADERLELANYMIDLWTAYKFSVHAQDCHELGLCGEVGG